jgi:hypothetical protein
MRNPALVISYERVGLIRLKPSRGGVGGSTGTGSTNFIIVPQSLNSLGWIASGSLPCPFLVQTQAQAQTMQIVINPWSFS